MEPDHRLHPLSFLFEVKQHARNLLAPALVVLVTASFASWQLFGLPLFAVYGIVSIVRYLSFRYRYGDDEIVIRTGFLFRNERHIPYHRIQNIDSVQNLLHRLLGVAEVRVQTAAGNEPEATMKVLPLAALEEMRGRVFPARRAEAAKDEAEAAASPHDRVLLRLGVRDLLVYGFIENRGMLMIAAMFGLIWEFGLMNRVTSRLFGGDSAGGGFLRDVAMAVFGKGQIAIWKIAATVLAFVLLLLGIRVLSMVWAAIRLYGFTLARSGKDLRTDFGLLTKVSATIPLDRIQTLTVREGMFHRLFGRVSVRVETAGGEGEESDQVRREWLAPVIRKERLPEFLAGVLPGIDLASPPWQGVPPRAVRRVFKAGLYIVAGVLVGLGFLLRWNAAWAVPFLVLWAWINARRYVAHLGYAETPAAILFRSGWLRRQTTVARFAKIQTVSLTESPFDRRSRMAEVSVDTAGASGAPHRIQIPYLDIAEARRLHALLFGQAARTVFRW